MPPLALSNAWMMPRLSAKIFSSVVSGMAPLLFTGFHVAYYSIPEIALSGLMNPADTGHGELPVKNDQALNFMPLRRWYLAAQRGLISGLALPGVESTRSPAKSNLVSGEQVHS